MPGSDRPNVLKIAQSVPGAWPTIPALTRLMSSQATFEPVSAKTQPVSGHTTCQIPDIENSCSRDSSRKTPPRWEASDFPRQRPAYCPLTLGNVGGSPTPGNHTAETGLAGWGARIRTWEWRNQNPLPYHLATPQRAPDHTCGNAADQSPDEPQRVPHWP